MKNVCKKLSAIMRQVFGWGVLACVLIGGLTFFGYVAALCIGGNIAAAICHFISKILMPIIIKTSSALILLGIVSMYLNKEK